MTALLKTTQINYYHTKSPFTSVKVSVGSPKEQLLNVLHSQNVNPFLNVTFLYAKFNSLGFYKNQQSSNSNILFNSNYTSKFDPSHLSNSS